MAKIGNRVKDLRKKMRLTQKEFASKAGVPLRTLASLEIGEYKPGYRLIEKIAITYHVDLQWLFFGEDKKRELPILAAESKSEYGAKTKCVPVPIVNEVPAGYPHTPLIPDEDFEVQYFYITGIPKKAFGFLVNGPSMEPELHTGDIVIVSPTPDISELKKGDIAIFRMHGGITIKIFFPSPDNKSVILQPFNPKSEPIIVTEDSEECTLIGKVIYKIVQYNKK